MRTLRARVTAITVLTAAAGLALGAWGFARVTERALLDRLRSEVGLDARDIAARAGDGEAPRTLLNAVPNDRLVAVRRPDGTLLAASDNSIRQSADLDELEIRVGDHVPAPGAGWLSGDSDLGRLDDGWLNARAVTDPPDRFAVVVAAPLADLRQSVDTVTDIALAALPVLVGAIGALVWFALGRLLRPIEDLRRQAAAAVDVYPPPRLEATSGGAEIEALIATLGDLLQRSAAGVRRQRRFLANASHELLSPLAALRTVLEVARRRNDPAATPRVIERSLEAQARLEQTAQQLLTLARAEEAGHVQLVDVDLAALVREVSDEVTATAVVPVRVHMPGTLVVSGDRVGLRQLVDNLLRNAVRHASAHVEVRLHATRDAAQLDVEDDGPGIPRAHRHLVFEPFVRLDEARARRDGGAGLGLAIAHAVAVGHGGTVASSRSPLGGARFRVVLPRRAAALPAPAATEASGGVLPPGAVSGADGRTHVRRR